MNVRVPFTEEQIAWIDARIKSGMSAYVREESLHQRFFDRTPPLRVLQPGDVVTSAEAQTLPAGSLVRSLCATYERCALPTSDASRYGHWVTPPLSVTSSQRGYCETQPDGSRVERVGPEKPSYTVVDGEAEIIKLRAQVVERSLVNETLREQVASRVEIIEALRADVEELRAQNENLHACNRTAVSASEHLRVKNDLAEALEDRKFLVEKVEDMRRIVESIGKVST